MNNFINNLQKRERALLSALLLIIFVVVIIFGVSSYITKHSISVKNLNKAKSNYEYVYSKALILERAIIFEDLTKEAIYILLNKSGLDKSITEIEIAKSDLSTLVMFKTLSLKDGVNFSEDIANNTKMNLKKITYTHTKETMVFELVLN
jgi:aminopeptidase-like protein